ncbi:glycosyltransferase family A protein [Microvirga calopogonii]|uniref:glycosyltransferase family A protein n=1 Tax=Microvirga calopogonii TaxID=2078013 RepID=UPI0013B3FE3A|nr:glycosyltransferase family A protein [Microvirga calopogonii]
MNASLPDITAVLCVHQATLLAPSSLHSLIRASEAATTAGMQVELLVMIACPRAEMRSDLIAASSLGARVIEFDINDSEIARNLAIEVGRGRFFAFLEGNNLWCRDWLIKAYNCAMESPSLAVWHPEASLWYGSDCEPYWMVHDDIDTAPADWVLLGLKNHWTSQSFAPREVHERVPYCKTDLAATLDYENWRWNTEAVACGYLHRTVLGTSHIIRAGSKSPMADPEALPALMPASSLFRRKIGVALKQHSHKRVEATYL